MWKIDEDASFSRCVLLDGRELDGDWWIARPLGVLGSSGILLVQDRISGTIAPLTSVMLLVAADAPSERSAGTAPAREDEPQAPAWQPVRLQPEPAVNVQAEPAAPRAAPGSEWGDILREDIPQGLPELDSGVRVTFLLATLGCADAKDAFRLAAVVCRMVQRTVAARALASAGLPRTPAPISGDA